MTGGRSGPHTLPGRFAAPINMVGSPTICRTFRDWTEYSDITRTGSHRCLNRLATTCYTRLPTDIWTNLHFPWLRRLTSRQTPFFGWKLKHHYLHPACLTAPVSNPDSPTHLPITHFSCPYQAVLWRDYRTRTKADPTAFTRWTHPPPIQPLTTRTATYHAAVLTQTWTRDVGNGGEHGTGGVRFCALRAGCRGTRLPPPPRLDGRNTATLRALLGAQRGPDGRHRPAGGRAAFLPGGVLLPLPRRVCRDARFDTSPGAQERPPDYNGRMFRGLLPIIPNPRTDARLLLADIHQTSMPGRT